MTISAKKMLAIAVAVSSGLTLSTFKNFLQNGLPFLQKVDHFNINVDHFPSRFSFQHCGCCIALAVPSPRVLLLSRQVCAFYSLSIVAPRQNTKHLQPSEILNTLGIIGDNWELLGHHSYSMVSSGLREGGVSIGWPLCRETSVSQTADVSCFFSVWPACILYKSYILWFYIHMTYR